MSYGTRYALAIFMTRRWLRYEGLVAEQPPFVGHYFSQSLAAERGQRAALITRHCVAATLQSTHTPLTQPRSPDDKEA